MHGSSSAGTPAIKREGANLPAPDRRRRGNLPSREQPPGSVSDNAFRNTEPRLEGHRAARLSRHLRDRILANAGAVTFFTLLALFPGIAALVSVYGLFSDAGSIGKQLDALAGILPGGAIEVIGGQLARLTGQPSAKLGFGFVFGLLVSLWSANGGIKALFDALNTVYEETRSAVSSGSTPLA